MEEINQQIDSNLNLICKSNNQQIYIHKLLDNNEKALNSYSKGELFADEMESRGLIRRKNKLCLVTELGYDIYKNGGWLKHLENKNAEDLKTEKKQSEKEKLELEISLLTKEKLEHHKKIREQQDRIRNLEEKIKIISLIKLYWWIIPTCIGIGIALVQIWISIRI